jgi:hypothetical protein
VPSRPFGLLDTAPARRPDQDTDPLPFLLFQIETGIVKRLTGSDDCELAGKGHIAGLFAWDKLKRVKIL